MNNENKGSILKFILIIGIACLLALFIYKPWKNGSTETNNTSPQQQSQIPADLQGDQGITDQSNMDTPLLEGEGMSPIIGANHITVQQGVVEFLKNDYENGKVPIDMKVFTDAVKNYSKGEYEKAFFRFEKNTLSKDPVTAILKENAKIKSAKEDYVKIAIATPLTGDSKEMGIKELLGAALFQEQVNESGGISGRKLIIQMADDRADKTQTEKVASILARDTELLGVVGHYTSGTTLVGAKIYEENKIVEITPSSSSPLISNAGKYIFRVCPSDLQQGAYIAEYAVRKLGNNINCALVYNPKDAYSLGLYKSIVSSLTEKNISKHRIYTYNHNEGLTDFQTIVENVKYKSYTYNEGETDFQTIAENIKNSNYDTVFFTGNDVEGNFFLSDLKGIGKDLNIFAGDAMFTLKVKETAGESFNKLYVSTFFHADAGYKFQEHFTNAFLKRYNGGTPNAVCALTYDAFDVFKKALEATQQFDREGVLAGMNQVSFQGATGRIKFDTNGDVPDKTLVMLKVESGKFVPTR